MNKQQFDALSEVIGSAGSQQFSTRLMDAVCQWAQLDHLALDIIRGPSRQKLSEGVSITSSMFSKAVLASSPHRLADRSVAQHPSSRRKISVRRLNLNLTDLRCRESEFYLRFGVVDGIELQWTTGQASFHLDLYRTHRLGRFSNAEEATLTAAADLLVHLVELHGSLCQLTVATSPSKQPKDVLQIIVGLLADGLTPRENAVACRIAAGMDTNEIAEDMGVMPATVITFRKRAYAKLGIGSRAELFARCFQLLLSVEGRGLSLVSADNLRHTGELQRAI